MRCFLEIYGAFGIMNHEIFPLEQNKLKMGITCDLDAVLLPSLPAGSRCLSLGGTMRPFRFWG